MRVIVAGGGVAGTVTAIALRRTGAAVTIFEAHDDPAGDIGSFLSLAANGMRGLGAIDCLDRVRARGFPVARQRMWSGSGRLLGDVPRARLATDPRLSVTLMRAHLVTELRAAAQDAGVRIVTGERLVAATDTADGVQARFTSGTTVGADLLVGADGIWSATRHLLDRNAPAPAYAGLYSVSGVARGVDTDDGVFNLVFGRNGSFIYLRAPDGDVWWQAQVASQIEPVDLDTAEWLPRLRELYAKEKMPSRILEATSALRRPTVHHVLDLVPTWYGQRIVLVGDAAHPVGAGQGAAMAIEDGLTLAAALSTSDSTTIATGFANYHRIRRPRVAKMLKLAEDNRNTKKAGPIKRMAERVLMPVVFRHFYEKATGWLYAYEWEAELGSPPKADPVHNGRRPADPSSPRA